MEHRYLRLHLDAALSRRCDYAQACKELANIMRRSYRRAPKAVQLLMYQDVRSSFRLLAGMDTIQQLSGAEALLQAVEATLPKKKRAAAVTEYRQAAVAQHRWAKQQESEKREDSVEISRDLLEHIFGFLDVRSLAISSVVCRAWNDASNIDVLWRTHYLSLFEEQDLTSKSVSNNGTSGPVRLDCSRTMQWLYGERQCFWRIALAAMLSQQGSRSRLFSSNRAFCTGCKALYWLSEHAIMQKNAKNCLHPLHKARPASLSQVLTFVLRKPFTSSSSSSSDSDTDEDFSPEHRKFSKLWSHLRIRL